MNVYGVMHHLVKFMLKYNKIIKLKLKKKLRKLRKSK